MRVNFLRTVTAACAAAFMATAPGLMPAAMADEIDVSSKEPSMTYDGPSTCTPKGKDGSVRAMKPGECAQFGTVGQERSKAKAKNVILIIGDGMGQQEITLARDYLKGAAGRFEGLDAFTSVGAYTHHSIKKDGSFDYVTDSAASATGWATGTKTYNGAIGVDLDGKPVESLLEKAKKAGMRTGNVTTAEIEDATPAALIAHSTNRKCYGPVEEKNKKTCQGDAFKDQYRENGGLGSIAEQLIDTRADVTLGGGLKAFKQESQYEGPGKSAFLDASKTTWKKGESVLDNAKDNGYQIVTDKDGLAKITEADQDKPVLGLFNDGNMITRFTSRPAVPGGSEGNPQACEKQDTKDEPELADMTEKALQLLDKPTSDKGFFLQIESASIDKRAHAADACGVIGEVDRIDETIKKALDFAKKDGNTLVVVTADHAHSSEIIYDHAQSVSATDRLKTEEGQALTVAYGTIPAEEIAKGGSQQHNGSQLRVAAFGPGEENVIGQIDQTDLFFVMANALGLNDVPTIEPSVKLPDSARTYKANTKDRKAPADALKTCYEMGNPGHAAKPGDCAQFGTHGQGLDKSKAKNVIIFIGDGMGDSEITSARNYLYGADGRLKGIDALPYTGYYTTFSLDAKRGGPDYVTDSAASGTGWSTGTKTYNGGIGVQADGTPVPNLIELAKNKGLKTGNVTTAEIQDATPAVMGSHALNRKCYGPEEEKNKKSCQGEKFKGQFRENNGLGSISEQLIDTRADITLGGGAKYMDQLVQVDGNWAGHEWKKDVSVLDNAKNQGFQVVTDVNGLNAVKEANQKEPVLGLFAPGNMPRLFKQSIPTQLGPKEEPTKCEKNPKWGEGQPTLAEMTKKAVELLDNDKGFLLQVESASIDKANHAADGCGQIGEAYQFDQAIAWARQWAHEHGDNTLIITTADHAHTSQIVSNGKLTSGRASKFTTADGDPMTMNWATASSNDDKVALGSQTHTGAQLRVAAEGPGAANVVGQIDQTDIHYVVANALGLYEGNPKIDLTPQWGKSAKPASKSMKIWLIAGVIILLVIVAAVALIASRRKKPGTTA